MVSSPDDLRARIKAYPGRPGPARRGCVEVVRANTAFTLRSLRTGERVARLHPTGQGDRVRVPWWRRKAWGNPGPSGRKVTPFDEALAFTAAEGFFRVHAP